MTSMLAVALLLGSATPDLPATTPNTPAEASTAASARVSAEKSRVRCKSFRPSGTRFDKKVCKTVAEWERVREESRDAMKDIQNKPVVNIGRGN